MESHCPSCGGPASPFDGAGAECLACRGGERREARVVPAKPTTLVCLEERTAGGYELRIPPKGARAIPIGLVGALFVATACVALGHALAGNGWAYVIAAVQGGLGLLVVYLAVAAGVNTRRIAVARGALSARTGPVPTLMAPLTLPLSEVAALGTEVPGGDGEHDPERIYVKTTDGTFHPLELELEADEAAYLVFRLREAVEAERERARQGSYREAPTRA